jgi:putative chitinase
LSAFSVFSPYSSLPDDPGDWVYDPPVLASSVGWQQPNFPEDVLLIQRIVNIIIQLGYLEDWAVTPLQESSYYDAPLDQALGAIEEKYLSGMASPLGQKNIANGSPLFVFMVHLAAGNANLVTHYSPLMYQLARVMLPDAQAAPNLTKYLSYILRALALYGLADTEMVLMAFATIRAESATVAPISEGVSKYNSSPAALRHEKGTHLFDLYDNRADLGNQGAPDGASYKGRGFVQLTGRDNYAKYGKSYGWPLTRNPDLANDPWAAAVLLARYMKDHEKRIRGALRRGDLEAARRAVNGGTYGIVFFRFAMRSGRAFLQKQIAGDAGRRLIALAGTR